MRLGDVFKWRELSDWAPKVAAVIPQKARRQLVALIQQSRQMFRCIDDVGCLRQLYAKVGDYDQILAHIIHGVEAGSK